MMAEMAEAASYLNGELKAVLQEVDADSEQPKNVHPIPGFQPTKLTEALLSEVLDKLEKDELLVSLHDNITMCKENVSELLASVSFLQDCAPSGCFTPAVVERAEGQWYKNTVIHHQDVSKITRSEQLTLFLCRRLFDCLTKQTQSSTPTLDAQFLSDEDKDIVNYIGGSVVSKLKKAAWQHTSEKEERLVILRTLQVTHGDKAIDHSSSESKEDVHSKMTHTLDRGGLVYLKPKITEMFWLLECLFCQASKGTTFSKYDYMKVCCSNNEVLCNYFETVYEAEGPDELKEELLGSLICLYFKIRIYQRCRVFMDKIRGQKQMAKKQKGLRKTLLMKVGK